MKIFKIILILVLLFSMSVFGSDITRTADIQDGDITSQVFTHGSGMQTLELHPYEFYNPDDSMNWDPDYTYWTYTDISDKPDTLLEWFKDLTLSQKVAIYYLVEGDKNAPYDGKLFIRLDDVKGE